MDGCLLVAQLSLRIGLWKAPGVEVLELSGDEVVGALGRIKDEFSRELLCHICCPEGSRQSSKDVEREVLHKVLSLCKVRAMQALMAQLNYNIADLELTTSRRHSSNSPDVLGRYQQAMDMAKERRWPSPSPVYQKLAHQVLEELRTSECCSRCRGVGRQHATSHVPCPRCEGSGRLTRSDLARGRALNMTWHAYKKSWRNPYEWTIAYCEGVIRSAGDELCRNLGCTHEMVEQSSSMIPRVGKSGGIDDRAERNSGASVAFR